MTFIGYPDITATSESGRFRIEISGTAGDHFFRDQSHFVYRLFDSNSNVWEWSPHAADEECDALDDSPHEAWVSDQGWTVVRSHGPFTAGLLVISPDGKVVLRRHIRRWRDDSEPGFLDGEQEQFISDTSAGPFWSRCSIAYFSEFDERLLWTIRTWWGGRVAIDLRAHEFVDANEFDVLQFETSERSLVQRTLAENIDRLEAMARLPKAEENGEEFWSIGSDVLTAAYQAGWLQSFDSIPHLRRLEVLTTDGSSAYGPVEWAVLHELSFRRTAKRSLLLLGQQPMWRTHYLFELRKEWTDDADDEDDDDVDDIIWFEFPEISRARTPEGIEVGMSQQELLKRIGAPDDILRHAWDYDFFSSERSFTVRIAWDETVADRRSPTNDRFSFEDRSPRVSKFEVIEPQWNLITSRRSY